MLCYEQKLAAISYTVYEGSQDNLFVLFDSLRPINNL